MRGVLFLVILALLGALFATAQNAVEQMHLAQGSTSTEMRAMWVTQLDASSECEYYATPGNVLKVVGDKESYSFGTYNSGTLHSALLTGLSPKTKYTYKCGDSIKGIWSPERSFTTLPAAGDATPYVWGVVGDMGVTPDSKTTMEHCQANKVQGMLHAGDLSYANCNQPIWDDYGRMVEPLAATIPWMVGPGNHEIEWYPGSGPSDLFKAFEARYKMPEVKAAEFGKIIIPPGRQDCTPSVFLAEYNYGASFYSFEVGLTHFTYLNCYSTSDANSAQYAFALNDFKSVDKSKTPWLVAVMHCPWYNSNVAHADEPQTVQMKTNLEALFYQYGVNVAFQGHVHAYERSYPVFNNLRDPKGTTYINIGDAGNAEGHATNYVDPEPVWSAYRNGTQYGHGLFSVLNATTALWEWNRNIDGVNVSSDKVYISNH